MNDQLHEHAIATANAVKELRDENRKSTEIIQSLEARIASLESENLLVREQWNRDKASADFYQAYCIELTTQLGTVKLLIDEIEAKSKDEAWRPKPGPKPNVEAVISALNEQLPTFLTPESKITQIPKKIERKV